MIKQVTLFNRKPGMPVEEFQAYWRDTHAQLVRGLPGIRGYIQNHTLISSYQKQEPDFDGVAEVWFDSLEAMQANTHTSELSAVRADEENFIDRISLRSVLTSEVVIIDEPRPMDGVKNIACLNKRDDMSAEDFQARWKGQHAELAKHIPAQRRYVQCHCRLGIYKTGRLPFFDGIPMSWFDSLDDLQKAGASDEYKATRADEVYFMKTGRLPFVISREVEVIPLPQNQVCD